MESKSNRLWTISFVNLCTSQFLLYFSVYLVMPVLGLYIVDSFENGKSVVGILLAAYTITAMLCRPFAGYIIDTFSRKPLYLFAYVGFVSVFGSYLLIGTLTLICIVRVFQGFSFGIFTTTANTIAVDLIPPARRGSGIVYFGITATAAFMLGPMTGIFINSSYGIRTVFATALTTGSLGLLLALLQCTPPRPKPEKKTPIAFKRFFLVAGLPLFINMLFVFFSYGITMNYMALYARELGIGKGAGFFFGLLSSGIILSRLVIGRLIDRGHLLHLIIAGLSLLFISFTIFALNPFPGAFYGLAFFIGVGFGLVSPGFQNLFVNLGNPSERGIANGTFLSGWDLGIATGTLLGAPIAQHFGYNNLYLFGAGMVGVGLLIFIKISKPHYLKNKINA